MASQDKINTVQEITEKLSEAEGLYIVDYRGITVKQFEPLRQGLREANSELKIYKNNLVKIALENQDIDGLDDLLVGPTACVFVENDPVGPAKALKDFAKENDKLEIKGGWSAAGVLSVEQISAIADLPSTEELIAKLLGTLQNPVTKVVRVLNGPAQGLVTALSAIADQKKQDEAA